MTAAPDTRRRELAQIHIAKAQLGLDEETYRAMLWTVGRVRSSADLDYAGRKAVLEHMKARGFKATAPKEKRPSDWGWVNNAAPDRQAMLRKIAVMLKAADRKKHYADGMAKHMFGIELIEFCAPDQLHRIVAALVKDQTRQAVKASA
ncbi:MAG: regulatory protein GemA [Thermoleophilia bacterium]|nr:regulatory protein GemA [Thermoleophilia bacterium]